MSKERIVLEVTGKDAASLIDYAMHRGFSRFIVEEKNGFGGANVSLFKRSQGKLFSGHDPVGEIVIVRSPGELAEAAERLLADRFLLIEFQGESMIPLENLLAMRKGQGTLWIKARKAEAVPGFIGALEHGSDAVVVDVWSRDDVDAVEVHVDAPPFNILWREVEVSRVVPGGSGERVIVDTTSMLDPKEGILVGSSGALLLHVASEAVGSRYTRPRPFRVNAGALHSYTLLSDGETRYLSELEPGDRVVALSPSGTPRTVRVGRLKTERRPMTMVEVKSEGASYTLFAQEAETVRLSGVEGVIPVTEIKIGDRLWGVSLPRARHFGKVVDESIVER